MGTQWIYVGNNSKVEGRGIYICKLKLKGSRSLLLHDVLYVHDIRWNLASVVVLPDFSFRLSFYGSRLSLYYDNAHYECGFLSNCFMILDMDLECFNVLSCSSIIASSCNSIVDHIIWHTRLGHNG